MHTQMTPHPANAPVSTADAEACGAREADAGTMGTISDTVIHGTLGVGTGLRTNASRGRLKYGAIETMSILR